ncbi:Leucyl aminopeptidase (aminopeptidase T) [Natronincola peptidivorans]|uniref:Leucyl aminopeptidase (Aminopeptidase T) n=1 Tax=Natronincola peptidivorans TaxID=426128 RepID=A0A1I0CAK9_9FIRM|nr:aminopeptidase [Natronincola peptidivorans]SET16524.1 Leucyl aminopeptidase (aminopeptidase T) [Natronincola peptidivorans]
MNTMLLEKYARLLVKTGINIQKNQTLMIHSPIEAADFTRIIARIAYEEGARDVVINWKDELTSKIKYLHAPEEVFEEFPNWQKEMYISYASEGAAFLSISASDPELMKDVAATRIAKAQKTASTALKEYRERLMENKNTWCVASIPTKAWAKKVFSHLSEEEAVQKLWTAILEAVRVNTEDPVDAWQQHKDNLKKRTEFLNTNRFKLLHFKNSQGTDLKIQLSEEHLWIGGSEYTPEGVEFIANMPTEEVFTAPSKNGVNGTVVSTKPFNYNGNLIEDFTFTFKDGKIVGFTAKKGYDTLKGIMETDEGAHYLGEVALVPYNSPISNANILFYNTLFDENASSHLALGKAYPVCIKDGENKSKEELDKLGVNDSLVHEDFMIGTPDLEIIGITAEGKEILIFKDGNFAF